LKISRRVFIVSFRSGKSAAVLSSSYLTRFYLSKLCCGSVDHANVQFILLKSL
jgi:hypothetical protein